MYKNVNLCLFTLHLFILFRFECFCPNSYQGFRCTEETNKQTPQLRVWLSSRIHQRQLPNQQRRLCPESLPHGKCIDLIDSYRCHCDLPYTGRNCDIEMNPCVPNLCQNGAQSSQRKTIKTSCANVM